MFCRGIFNRSLEEFQWNFLSKIVVCRFSCRLKQLCRPFGKGVLTTHSYEAPKFGHSLMQKRNVGATELNKFLSESVYRSDFEVLFEKSVTSLSETLPLFMEFTPSRQGGGNSPCRKLEVTPSFAWRYPAILGAMIAILSKLIL